MISSFDVVDVELVMDLGPADLVSDELKVSILQYQQYQKDKKNTNTPASLLTKPDPSLLVKIASLLVKIEPLGVRHSKNPWIIRLIVTQRYHPSLFDSLPNKADDGIGFKYVDVHYPKTFVRNARQTMPVELPVRDRGRTSPHQAWWWFFEYINEDSTCWSCGKQDSRKKSKGYHYTRPGLPCMVARRQQNRTRCFFCDEEIKSCTNNEYLAMEVHTKYCRPLWELKTLIHPMHLEDHGLEDPEIDAFTWPVRVVSTDN